MERYFGSDNYSGVHPHIIEAISKANTGHVPAYGEDKYTEAAKNSIRKLFGNRFEPFFLFNGTGTNTVAICSVTRSFNTVFATDASHINSDECGAPEKLSGCKISIFPTEDGKLDSERIKPLFRNRLDQHKSQPSLIYISQATEFGTVYTPEEIRKLREFADGKNLLIYMDGARLANALVHLGIDPAEMVKDVDLFSFGGTKNGLLFGEVLMVKDSMVSNIVPFVRKQSTQLFSKMRFISAQFECYISSNLWKENAEHANKMADYFAERLKLFSKIKITQKVQSNAVFVTMPREVITPMQEKFHFYTVDEDKNEVRLMTSFDTTKGDVDQFITSLSNLLR